jgi:hypothetical protein
MLSNGGLLKIDRLSNFIVSLNFGYEV